MKILLMVIYSWFLLMISMVVLSRCRARAAESGEAAGKSEK
jgi:amino acid permease